MKPQTVAALHRINLDFYERYAAAFSATREAPWPGWRRAAALARSPESPPAGPSVLDIGCGNGRLARFLEELWPGRFAYLGIDASASLLELAAAGERRADCRFLRRDLLLDGPPTDLPEASFDLIAVFGLMHHLPGADSRRALLGRAASLLAPGGRLAVSFWQFGDQDRFRKRVVSWGEYNRRAAEPIDTADLDPGDVLLAWGEPHAAGRQPPTVRYCHWAPPVEVAQLLAGLPLEVIDGYRSDGASDDLNLYRLLGTIR